MSTVTPVGHLYFEVTDLIIPVSVWSPENCKLKIAKDYWCLRRFSKDSEHVHYMIQKKLLTSFGMKK